MKLNIVRIRHNFSIYSYLIGLTIVIIPLINRQNNNNYLMLLGYIVILFHALKNSYFEKDIRDYILMPLTMFVSAFLFNPTEARLSTILYSCMFIWGFLAFKSSLKRSNLCIDDFLNLLKILVLAYAVVLAIQITESFLGITNIINLNSDMSSKFKMNSLTWESSNTLLIVPLYMYTYFKLLEIKRSKKITITYLFSKEKLFIFLSLFICFCSGSMTVFFTVPILFLYILRIKNILFILTLLTIITFIIIQISKLGGLNIDRFTKFMNILFTFNAETIIRTDPSSATRIVPFFIYANSINLLDTTFWFGHGIDAMDKTITQQIFWYRTDNDYDMVQVGNILSVCYNYGVFTMITFLLFLRKYALSRWLSFDTFFYITVFSIITINHYLIWLFISLLYITKYYKVNINKSSINEQ